MSLVKIFWRTIVVALLVAYVSLIKTPSYIPEPNFPLFDKWIHLGMYFLLTLVGLFDINKIRQKNLYQVVIVCIVYGGVIEILQYFSLTRHPSWADLMANIVGCILAYFIYKIYQKVYGK